MTLIIISATERLISAEPSRVGLSNGACRTKSDPLVPLSSLLLYLITCFPGALSRTCSFHYQILTTSGGALSSTIVLQRDRDIREMRETSPLHGTRACPSTCIYPANLAVFSFFLYFLFLWFPNRALLYRTKEHRGHKGQQQSRSGAAVVTLSYTSVGTTRERPQAGAAGSSNTRS